MKNSLNNNHGFTLLELMLTLSAVVIIGAAGVVAYQSFFRDVELDVTAKMLISDLKRARDKAMAGENGVNWGLHIVSASSPYYEIFSSPTDYSEKTVVETDYLAKSVSFSNPEVGSSTDVIFMGIYGTTTSKTIGLTSSFGNSRTVTVSSQGTINSQ